VAHREVLDLSHSRTTGNNKNNNTIARLRFRASAIEGNLSQSLSAILTPLLRYNGNQDEEQDCNNKSDNNNNNHKPVHLRAESLMEVTNILLGGEVPLKMT